MLMKYIINSTLQQILLLIKATFQTASSDKDHNEIKILKKLAQY